MVAIWPLEHYRWVYEKMDEDPDLCISCPTCRFKIRSTCLSSNAYKCLKWIAEELNYPISDIYLEGCSSLEEFWIYEISRRIAQRLIGFAIAEMCLEGSK